MIGKFHTGSDAAASEFCQARDGAKKDIYLSLVEEENPRRPGFQIRDWPCLPKVFVTLRFVI